MLRRQVLNLCRRMLHSVLPLWNCDTMGLHQVSMKITKQLMQILQGLKRTVMNSWTNFQILRVKKIILFLDREEMPLNDCFTKGSCYITEPMKSQQESVLRKNPCQS